MNKKKESTKITRNKIILSIAIALVMTIITCIPIFAISYNSNTIPSDLGTIATNTNFNSDTLYLEIQLKQIPANTYSENFYYMSGVGTFAYYIYNNGNIRIPNTRNTSQNWTIQVLTSDIGEFSDGFIFQANTNTVYYIAVCIKNMSYGRYYEIDNQYIKITPYFQKSYTQEINEAYSTGYEEGYDVGLLEGQGIEQYTNLTGYVTQLLTQFVGSDTAPYITPIAIVLVILFVYFLFIRFLLSLIKAKGGIKTCDIIMIVACIILLVIMYAPMLNLTIKTQQINDIETTISEQIEQRNIYIYDDKGNIIGDIYNGITKNKETTNTIEQEDIYKIETDVDVNEYVTREQNN